MIGILAGALFLRRPRSPTFRLRCWRAILFIPPLIIVQIIVTYWPGLAAPRDLWQLRPAPRRTAAPAALAA
jgi:hypothetical protein